MQQITLTRLNLVRFHAWQQVVLKNLGPRVSLQLKKLKNSRLLVLPHGSLGLNN